MIPRRAFLKSGIAAAGAGIAGNLVAWAGISSGADAIDGTRIKEQTLAFIHRCARPDGGYAPSPDPSYHGSSDTAESDLAAVTYAATLSKPEGWQLQDKQKSVEFIQRHQQVDGSFQNFSGDLDPKSDLAVLYNTVQGVVGLRALGAKPHINPVHALDRFFEKQAYTKLPWYTVSFFPLFYAALGVPFPIAYRAALEKRLIENQAADGYLGDHVASTFHLVHFFRLIGEPTPRAEKIVARVLRDQRPDGGWHLKAPDWDVHACFDAVFILRQLRGNSAQCRRAIAKAAKWAAGCQNGDGGFGHYPKTPSDMDAVYFQFGTLVQAGVIPGTNFNLPDANTLSWGHVMQPDRIYPI